MSSYSFEREYRLVQQTPLIHFQHDQAGATLRATEVKPKLDRFLLRKFCKHSPELSKEEIYKKLREKGWMMQKSETLCYRMQITADGICNKSNTIELDIDAKKRAVLDGTSLGQARNTLKRERRDQYTGINAMYFGNMVNDRLHIDEYQAEVAEKYKETIFNSMIILRVRCFIPELLQEIDGHIREFFVLHNFGCRQSKGFGGFLTDDTTNSDVRTIISASGEPNICAHLPANTTIEQAMNHAMTLYAILKGGLNLTNPDHVGETEANAPYIKGYALRNYLDENTGSDKAYMKSTIVDVPDNRQMREANKGEYQNYVFIRALLGLTDHFEFRFRGYRQQTVFVMQYDSTRFENGRLCIDLNDIINNSGIHRLQSPILIKVYNNRIYFIMTPGYNEALGKIFLLLNADEHERIRRLKNQRNPDYSEIQSILEGAHYLATPTEFDPISFLDGFVTYFEDQKKRLGNFNRNGFMKATYFPSKDVTMKKVGEDNE